MNELIRRLLFLPEQASTFSLRSDHLHFFILGTTLLVGALIGAVALVFLIRFRRRSETATTPKVTAPRWLEGLFISVPLAFFLLWAALGFRDYLFANRPPKDALDVYVTAKQWMWKFSFERGPSELSELHVPTGRPVRLMLTSRDVIHSFFVPAFRLKRDALPGRYSELWFEVSAPGTYEILCAEYCGLDHSRMRARVIALEPGDFERWLDRSKRSLPDEHAPGPLVERGRDTAAKAGCFKCHSIDGTPHIAPTWVGLYNRRERLEDGREVLADEAYLTRSIMQPGQDVVAGFKPVMPSFHGALRPTDVAAIVEFIKSLTSDARVESKEPVYVPAGD